MSFRDSHPLNLRQDFALPNFADGDILDREYTIKILRAFQILGLNGVYVLNKDYKFSYFRIERMLDNLNNQPYKMVRIMCNNHKIWFETNIGVYKESEVWNFKNFKLYPTLTRIYNEK